MSPLLTNVSVSDPISWNISQDLLEGLLFLKASPENKKGKKCAVCSNVAVSGAIVRVFDCIQVVFDIICLIIGELKDVQID